MQKWLAVVLIFTFFASSFIVASNVNGALAEQIVATSTSIFVAVVGFRACFKKTRH